VFNFNHQARVSEKACHPGGLWPVNNPWAPCVCYNLFVKGWVTRPLSFSEILYCLDIPTSVVSQLLLEEAALLQLIVKYAALTAPPKVLLQFGTSQNS
jgi:hypothetical protein